MENGGRTKGERLREEVLLPFWQTSIFTTRLICGSSGGVELKLKAMLSSLDGPMTSFLDSNLNRMRIGSGRNSSKDSENFDWNCIPRRLGFWNSVATRLKTGRGEIKGSLRVSTFLASHTFVGRKEVTECSR